MNAFLRIYLGIAFAYMSSRGYTSSVKIKQHDTDIIVSNMFPADIMISIGPKPVSMPMFAHLIARLT